MSAQNNRLYKGICIRWFAVKIWYSKLFVTYSWGGGQGKRWWGIRELERGEKVEKGREEKKILRARSARRTKKGGETKGWEGGKEVDGGEPPRPPPCSSLKEKVQMLRFFRLWLILTRDDNVLVFTYTLNFYLFQKLAYSVINLANIDNVYNACTLYVVLNFWRNR